MTATNRTIGLDPLPADALLLCDANAAQEKIIETSSSQTVQVLVE